MSEIITATADERSRQAHLLHNKIMVSGVMVAQSLVQMCKDLKTMRDEKLYTELGYNDFGGYCDEAVGIGARQGYTYIQTYENLGSEVIEKYSSVGITKLSLLAKMNPVDRFDVLDNGNVSEMSTKDIKELVAKSTAQAEQLSLLGEETGTLKDENECLAAENDKLENLVESLKREVQELKERPIEISTEPSDEKIEELRMKLKEELKTSFENEKNLAVQAEKLKRDKELEKAKADAEKKALKNKSKEIEAAVEKAKAEVRAESEDLRVALESFKAENDRLAKELKAADSEVQKVVIYFQGFQDSLNKTLAEINRLNGEQKVKMTEAVKTALKQIIEQIGR